MTTHLTTHQLAAVLLDAPDVRCVLDDQISRVGQAVWNVSTYNTPDGGLVATIIATAETDDPIPLGSLLHLSNLYDKGDE